MASTLDLFPETVARRRPRRVRAHVTNVWEQPGHPLPFRAEFVCERCGWESGEVGVRTASGVRRGLACARCNPARGELASVCGSYRWLLTRIYGAGPTACVIGMNPSTADAEQDDMTVRRLAGFAERLGWGRLLLVNLFALRATDVTRLGYHPHPVGPGADLHLARAVREAEIVVGAWGAVSKAPREHRTRARDVALLVQREGAAMQCWGRNRDGSPKHPLYLSYEIPLEPWTASA